MLLSSAWEKVIDKQNLKQKISWHRPFNRAENGSSEEHFKKSKSSRGSYL